MVTISLQHNFTAGVELGYIIQLTKIKKMFYMKFYSLELLLKNVNRTIRSYFPESIPCLFEFWRTVCRNTSTPVRHDRSTGRGHQRRRHLIRSVAVPMAAGGFEQAGFYLGSKQWHVVWCPTLSSLQLLIALSRLANRCLPAPKTALAELWLPYWCSLVLKAL